MVMNVVDLDITLKIDALIAGVFMRLPDVPRCGSEQQQIRCSDNGISMVHDNDRDVLRARRVLSEVAPSMCQTMSYNRQRNP